MKSASLPQDVGGLIHRRDFRPHVIIRRHMKAIGEILKEKNLRLDTVNPVLQEGFTQVPNCILRNPDFRGSKNRLRHVFELRLA